MSALWEAGEFLAAVGGQLEGAAPAELADISIDSRSVRPGEAFFAIKGDRFDGHDFVDAALKAGAALAVVGQERRDSVEGEPVVVVPDDPLAALERLAVAARKRSEAKIVAVTGSVGKTGTVSMLRLGLSAVGPTHAPVASFNNHWGVPLTLARLPAETAFGVFEIGMNHAGEISPLSKMVRPHGAVITTVEAVHTEFFESMEAIADAKAEIFDGLERDGAAILNRDNAYFDQLVARAKDAGARVITFGEHPDADVSLVGLMGESEGSRVTVDVFGDTVQFRLGAPGRHLARNALSVLATAYLFGADVKSVALALEEFKAPPGRGDRHVLACDEGTLTLIDESYNANPASMQAAIQLLKDAKPGKNGRRIAVLGDMGELGQQAGELHRALAADLADAKADAVFLVGPLMHQLWEDLPEEVRGAYAKETGELEPILMEALQPGDVIVVKASNATGLGRLVKAIKSRFPPARAADES
ncbi:UDP-N-acetylmuramoylalanyl-D-glutamyl-2,6-diaminopimelate--D-alanyl-D-alanine ligase [Afifella pfennigii]|uniref:UDP-N-acetylmuramoylalanyl-D-glutamyl-2, 6-diaminopimelate--D-alanyl-D-alanine ligase n=1 Tax=Afifella pfennigii TaxID=209897 RepID=UPI000479E4B7|nr:UDP-N-acetylmuramoylalanyl-D-glutamyl-2,6-diaminopimelate--D-alanyl-D-alanine ligase [Afifella pfennigii]